MTPIKWVDPRELYNADKGDDGDVPVLTLDQLEVWLSRVHVEPEGFALLAHLLAQVQAWRKGEK
jgi:hypothetical protein